MPRHLLIGVQIGLVASSRPSMMRAGALGLLRRGRRNLPATMRAGAQRLVAALLAALLALPAQAGAPDYDAFCDRDGRITTKQHGLGLIKLVSSVVELEAVFEESRRGNARAKRVFEELETSYFPDTGRELAELVSRPPCLVPVLRELSGWCVPDWSFLDFLSKEKPGGVRLRVALLNGYTERARQRNLENRLILSAMTSILGVSVVASALREAGVAVSVSRVPGASTMVTLWRAVKAEELADIRTTGTFRNLGSAEGKYFSTTAEGAVSYAKQASRAWPKEGTYTLVRTEIPRSLLMPEMTATVDQGGIPAVVVPDALLPRLRPAILEPIPAP